jgi:hypothetical protein
MSEEERKEAAGQRDNHVRVARELVEAESEAEVAALINRIDVSAAECLSIALEKVEENERGVELVRWCARQVALPREDEHKDEAVGGLDAALIASSLNIRDPATAAAVAAELLPLAGGWLEGSPLVQSLRLVAASSQPLGKVQRVLEEFLKRRPPLGTPTLQRGKANNLVLHACQRASGASGAACERRDALLHWLSERRLGSWVSLLSGTVAEGRTPTGNLARLPSDLLGVVFEFANGGSWGKWCSMAGVCKAFYRWHLAMPSEALVVDRHAHMNDLRLCLMLGHSRQLAVLRRLDLGGCSNITDAGLASLSSSLTGLQTLNLYGCRNITDAGLSSLSSSLTGLQKLSLSSCENITDAGLSSLSSSLTGLQTLDLEDCYKITDAGLSSLSSSLTGLQTLNLWGCDKITDAGLASAAFPPHVGISR